MKTLSDYKEDVYKCSRCGLCQSVCPVYKTTLNECSVSRSKFNMLNGVLKGELLFSKRVKEYLDFCTNCNACSDFCPSKIDVCKIFRTFKNQYYTSFGLTLFERLLYSQFLFVSLMKLAKFFFAFCRFFSMQKWINLLSPFLLRFGRVGQMFLLMSSFIDVNCRYCIPKNNAIIPDSKVVAYFSGCINKNINSESYSAVRKILSKLDVCIIDVDFDCCGVSYYNEGLFSKFKKIAKKNISKMQFDYDYILTDCATCDTVLKSYKDIDLGNTACEFSDKVVSVFEFINSLSFETTSSLNIAVHVPCHEKNDIVSFVKNINGINYVESESFDSCCGFSGKFAIQNFETSKEISKNKVIDFVKAGADVILTTCPACMLGLRQGTLELNKTNHVRGNTPTVMNLYVFLAEFCSLI